MTEILFRSKQKLNVKIKSCHNGYKELSISTVLDESGQVL